MKKSLYLFLAFCFLAGSISCSSSTEDNEYAEACKYITRTSHPDMSDRSLACKNCCIDNGWDHGTYTPASGPVKEGCECFNK